MNIKQTTITVFIGLLMVLSTVIFVAPSSFAEECRPDLEKCCGETEVALVECSPGNGDELEDSPIWELLLNVLNFLTAGVGIVAVGGIVYGAILYTTAGDKAEQVKKASSVIGNVVVGLVAFILLYAIIQYLVPGGVFN